MGDEIEIKPKKKKSQKKKPCHQCTQCGRTFDRPSRLKDHYSAEHLGKKLHKCSCGLEFASYESLSSHKREGHSSEYKLHLCTNCDPYKSKRKFNVKRHLTFCLKL